MLSFNTLCSGSVSCEQLNYVWEELKYFFWGDREANLNSTKEPTATAASTTSATADTIPIPSADDVMGEDFFQRIQRLRVSNMKGNEENDPTGLQATMTHTLELISAAGYPAYSNYTPTFKHLLDYVMVQREHFEVLRVAPFPTEEVLSEFVALPSAVIPSDHISILVDLKWN